MPWNGWLRKSPAPTSQSTIALSRFASSRTSKIPTTISPTITEVIRRTTRATPHMPRLAASPARARAPCARALARPERRSAVAMLQVYPDPRKRVGGLRRAAALALRALPGSDRVVRDLGRVAATHQHLPGAVALAVVLRRLRVAPAEQHERGSQLGVAAVVRDRGVDQLWRDPAAAQVGRDPLGAPLVELALVLRELAGVAGVVEGARFLELRDRIVDRLRCDVLLLEPRAQLGHREVTAGDRLVGEVDRPLALGASHGLGGLFLRHRRGRGVLGSLRLLLGRWRLYHAQPRRRLHAECVVDL